MQKSLFLISDYGTGDPAFAEVMLQFRTLVPDVFTYPQSVPAFSTINTGFWIYQIAMTPHIKNTYIFSNTAPRKEKKEAMKNNLGEKLMYAKLRNGFELMAINAGHCFSFIKPHIEHLCYVNVANEGTQFRSRDIYPHGVARMINGSSDIFGETADPSLLPDAPQDVIASIDGYGNIKTVIRKSQVTLTLGKEVNVTINNTTHQAQYTDGSFNVHEGELAFAPGSSGHDDPFMELFYRGKSAASLFNNPHVEDAITFQPL